jgi:hypothetical protein
MSDKPIGPLMPKQKKVRDFEVFQVMSDRNLDISLAVEVLDCTRTPKRNGGRVTIGVASPSFDHIINGLGTGEQTHYALLYVINVEQYNAIKKEIENK